ncbi:MAG: polymorphic toxin type 15 domain-containing protein, partial [Cystobacter sp.]
WEVLSGSGKALYELSLRLNPITAPQKFKEDLQALKDTYQALQRFADEDLEAYAVLMGDPSTYSLLWQFGQDFLSAQHSLEITEGGGELAFDVILAVITAGAGAVASSRHAAKLKKLKTVVDELVDSLKSKKRRQRTRREPPNRRITTRVQLKHVPCFCPYNGKGYRRLSPHERKDYLQEYDRQLRRQQDALNNMTVDEYLTAREAYARHGRNPVADTMQENARDDFRSDVVGSITKSLRRQNPSLGAAEITRQANARADSLLDKLAALHEPDMVAGGWSDPMPKGMGDSAVNSASGASWNQKDRLSSVDEQATQARTAGQGQEKMNVKLEVCRGKRHCP